MSHSLHTFLLLFVKLKIGVVFCHLLPTQDKSGGRGEEDLLIMQAFARNLFIISLPIGKKQPLFFPSAFRCPRKSYNMCASDSARGA